MALAKPGAFPGGIVAYGVDGAEVCCWISSAPPGANSSDHRIGLRQRLCGTGLPQVEGNPQAGQQLAIVVQAPQQLGPGGVGGSLQDLSAHLRRCIPDRHPVPPQGRHPGGLQAG